jgi:hypothetical protein
VVVDDSTEAESAPPASRHIQDVDPEVALRSTLVDSDLAGVSNI